MTKTPIFPAFKKLDQDFYYDYQLFISKFPQHCDYTLNNLLVWTKDGYDIEYCWLNDNIVFKNLNLTFINLNPDENVLKLTIVGVKDADDSLKIIFDTYKDVSVEFAPDYFIEKIRDKSKYNIVEDVSNRDYIIEINQLLDKKGSKYENFRYQIKYFLKKYSDNAVVKDLDLTKQATIVEIVNAMHTWPFISSFIESGNDPFKLDAKAINRLFLIQSELFIKHQAIGLYVDSQLQGFSIYHIPPYQHHIALGNHIKYNGTYKRLFDFLVYSTASKLHTQNIKLLNAEQDMGLPGIRTHKMDLNPVYFYKKYNITRL